MDIVYLGYTDLDFNTVDGKHIDGIKFYYYFKTSSSNHYGYAVGSEFVPRQHTSLIQQVKAINPLSKAHLDMGYNGKRAIFNGIIEVK